MKKILLGLMIGSTSVVSWSACVYNLNATSQQIASLSTDLTTTKFPSVVQQEVGYTIYHNENDLYNLKNYGAASSTFIQSNPIGDLTIGNTGNYALEYKINNFYTSLITNDDYFSHGFAINLTDMSSVRKIGAMKLVNDSSGLNLNFFIQDMGGSNTVFFKYPISNTVSLPFRFGLYINQNSKQIGFNVNGVDKGYLTNFTGNVSRVGLTPLSWQARVNANAPMIGHQIKGELIMDRTKYGLNYALGTKDLCGNAI